MLKNTFKSLSSISYDFCSSTIFQTHLTFDDINFLGRWLDGGFLRNHSPKCWFSSFSQSQNSSSRRPIWMKLGQVAVLSSSRTWKNFTVRSLLDGEIWLCENGQKNSASLSPDVVLWPSSPPHIFMLKPLLLWTDGILLRIRLVLRPLNTFVLDENIFVLDFLGGQHSFTERNDTPCTFCTAEPCWTPKRCKKKIFSSKTNVFSGRSTNLIRNNKPSVHC